MKALFFSDAHLGRREPDRVRSVARFILSAGGDADVVAVLGDLFEFYYGQEGYVYPWYAEVMDALTDLAKAGKKVIFLEGNHEFNMPGISASTGIACADELVLTLDGQRVYLAHGDAFTSPRFRAILKSGHVIGLMRRFGPDLSWKIAMAARVFLSRRDKSDDGRAREAFRRFAERKLGEGYDAIVLGHSHVPDMVDYGVGGRSRIYCNTGDLAESASYVEYTSSAGFQVRHLGSATAGGLSAGAAQSGIS